MWRNRELVGTLAQKDLKVRYRQTAIGVTWTILQPLAGLLLFYVFFTLLGVKPGSGDVPYELSLLAGYIAWLYCAAVIQFGTQALVINQPLVTKVYFPRLVLPAAVTVAHLVDLAVNLCLMTVFMAAYRHAPTVQLAVWPVALLLLIAFAFAVAVWLSAMHALYRDVGHTVPFLLQMALYATPVIYELRAMFPPRWQWAAWLNPLAGIIETWRAGLIGTSLPPTWAILWSALSTAVLLWTGLIWFRSVERNLADRI